MPRSGTQSPDSAKGSNKRVASPDAPPPQQVGFEFLNFSHPSQAKASGARRTVRSHVTRQQHQREQLAAAAARRSKSMPQGPEQPPRPPKLRMHHTIGYSAEEDTRSNVSPTRSAVSEPSSAMASAGPSPSPARSPTQALNAKIDPYDLYPSDWHSSIPVVVDHYLSQVAPTFTDFEGPAGNDVLRQLWFPFISTDATLLHTVILFATSHYRFTQNPDPINIDAIALRGMAIRGINQNLQDPSKSSSNELIATVLYMAAYEAVFGDAQTYATHMSGLQRLVQWRGGLPTLGLNGCLESMLLWIDSNASQLTGYDLFFPPTIFPSNFPHPQPDLARFSPRTTLQSQSPRT